MEFIMPVTPVPVCQISNTCAVGRYFSKEYKKHNYIFVRPQSISKLRQTAQLHYAHWICLSLFHVFPFRLEAIHKSAIRIYQSCMLLFLSRYWNLLPSVWPHSRCAWKLIKDYSFIWNETQCWHFFSKVTNREQPQWSKLSGGGNR